MRVPEHARNLIAAHRFYRGVLGAGPGDPFFVNQHEAARSPATLLRARTVATCAHLNLRPPWLHGADCSNGADIGLNRRSFGWLTE